MMASGIACLKIYSDSDSSPSPESAALVSPPIAVQSETRPAIVDTAEGTSPSMPRLDMFLPPLPNHKCEQQLQLKFHNFLGYKRRGKTYNAQLRRNKEYRNPDILLHAVAYQDIDQIGSCFTQDVFDPHGCHDTDFYDQLEADSERREQETKKTASNAGTIYSASAQVLLVSH